MRFLSVPVDEAAGKILGHNVVDGDGRRRLRKGRALGSGDIEVLRELGRSWVHVAVLEPGDVSEDEAADLVAASVCGRNLRLSRSKTGRVNAYTEALGLVRVDAGRLLELNLVEGVHLATRPNHAVIKEGTIACTLKIVPYALDRAQIDASAVLGEVIRLDALPFRRVGMILTGSPAGQERITTGFSKALGPRLEELGSALELTDFASVDDDGGEERLAASILDMAPKVDLLILAGETAVVDRADIAPRAVERAGGQVISYGAPVDPGNLLLLAELGGLPVLGAPGCARSPMANIVDLVLPRLLAGDRLDRRDVARLGVGGLLDDVPERPMPRRRAG